jgi:hypothetical protein
VLNSILTGEERDVQSLPLLRNFKFLNLLAAAAILPAHSVSKNGQNLMHGLRLAPAQGFSQPPFGVGRYAGLCAAIVVFASCIVGDPVSHKHNFYTSFFSTSYVGVRCIRVGGCA